MFILANFFNVQYYCVAYHSDHDEVVKETKSYERQHVLVTDCGRTNKDDLVMM